MLENNQNIIDFIRIYENEIDANEISFDRSEMIFKLKNQSTETNSTINSVFNLEYLPANKFSINIKNLKIENLLIYHDVENFLNNFNDYKDNFENIQILILEKNSKTIFKGFNEVFTREKVIIFNNLYYHKILELLKVNTAFSNITSVGNEIIVVSKSNSIMHLGYEACEQRINELEFLKPAYELLEKRFYKYDLSNNKSDNTEFIKLFIENISTVGIGNELKNDRFFKLIKELKALISFTERDYDNYINEFSFEKIKSKFKEERNKYFEGIEKNIELVSKQVLSFPLTFAATAFASYQVKDSPLILVLIFIAFGLYTIVAFKILNISKYNIDCIEEDVTAEKGDINKNYSKNLKDFKIDFDKIDTKILKINSLIFYLKIILRIMISIFGIFVLFKCLNFETKNKNEILIPIEKVKYIVIEKRNKL